MADEEANYEQAMSTLKEETQVRRGRGLFFCVCLRGGVSKGVL